MNIALCIPFMESDLLSHTIQESLTDQSVHIDTYATVDTFLNSLSPLHYDVIFVAFKGNLGLDAVTAIRNFSKKLPIVWISDTEHYACISYSLAVVIFLMHPITPLEIVDSIDRIPEWRQRKSRC